MPKSREDVIAGGIRIEKVVIAIAHTQGVLFIDLVVELKHWIVGARPRLRGEEHQTRNPVLRLGRRDCGIQGEHLRHRGIERNTSGIVRSSGSQVDRDRERRLACAVRGTRGVGVVEFAGQELFCRHDR